MFPFVVLEKSPVPDFLERVRPRGGITRVYVLVEILTTKRTLSGVDLTLKEDVSLIQKGKNMDHR